MRKAHDIEFHVACNERDDSPPAKRICLACQVSFLCCHLSLPLTGQDLTQGQ